MEDKKITMVHSRFAVIWYLDREDPDRDSSLDMVHEMTLRDAYDTGCRVVRQAYDHPQKERLMFVIHDNMNRSKTKSYNFDDIIAIE